MKHILDGAASGSFFWKRFFNFFFLGMKPVSLSDYFVHRRARSFLKKKFDFPEPRDLFKRSLKKY